MKFSGVYKMPDGSIYDREIIADATRYFEGEPDGDSMIIRVGENSIIVTKESLKVKLI